VAYRADPEPYKVRARERYARVPDVVKAQATAWAQANPERRHEIRLASFRRQYAIDPERFRESWRKRQAAIRRGCAVYPFTTDQLAAKVAYWGFRCWICSGPFEAIDHVKPLAKQGPHMLANLRPICTACNTRKRDRWPFAA
jgi:5-methylcytosine-specific restriction endonuclease McrA